MNMDTPLLDAAIEKNNAWVAKFNPALATYVSLVQKVNDEYMQKNFPTLPRVVITVDRNSKYIRIVKGNENGGHRSLHSFVDRTNGNILKGSWKAPVKNGVRGSIFNENPMKGMDHHGPCYLR